MPGAIVMSVQGRWSLSRFSQKTGGHTFIHHDYQSFLSLSRRIKPVVTLFANINVDSQEHCRCTASCAKHELASDSE
jgi:hypothetical protein